MQFWIRHVFLVLSCVVFPFVVAIYFDTSSELRRAEREGGVAARFAGANLEARLTLSAHKAVNAALSLAQRFADQELLGDLQRKAGDKRREAALAAAEELVRSAAPEAGFAWVVDEAGAVLVRSDAPADPRPELIAGHPLFIETQEGYALDGLWREGERVAMVGAAPLVVRGQAQGAVLIGSFFEKRGIERLAAAVNSSVTLVSKDRILASSLSEALAADIVQTQAGASDVTSGGFLSAPLEARLPFLPLFLAHDARGFAYSSISQRMPGTDDVRWVISAAAAEPLRGLAERQELMLTLLVGFFVLATLIGAMNYRAFVSPIDRITHHLSELQQGRGELELPEARVSAPFRRLVKLVNMLVQRLPTRGFPARPLQAELQPVAEGAPAVIPPQAVAREASLSVLPKAELRLGDLLSAAPALPELPPALADAGSVLADDEASLEAPDDGVSSPGLAYPEEERDGLGAFQGGGAPSALPAPQLSALPLPSQSLSGQLRATSTPGAAARAGSMVAGSSASARIRSAADIRGVPSESIAQMSSPFSPAAAEPPLRSVPPRSESIIMEERTPIEEQLSVPATPASALRGASSARGGGSLNLTSYAGLGQAAGVGAAPPPEGDEGGFNPEATVVAPVADELLRKSASREDMTDHHAMLPQMPSGDMTMIASVPPNLLAQTVGEGTEAELPPELEGLDATDHAHFKETYERFIEMRKRCGEPTNDLAFDRFLGKLAKNREGLVKKYNCRTVRFQVYEKDGKAALKATPVRAK